MGQMPCAAECALAFVRWVTRLLDLAGVAMTALNVQHVGRDDDFLPAIGTEPPGKAFDT
jgi:hypothetical protein